jgi:hypothetical protein
MAKFAQSCPVMEEVLYCIPSVVKNRVLCRRLATVSSLALGHYQATCTWLPGKPGLNAGARAANHFQRLNSFFKFVRRKQVSNDKYFRLEIITRLYKYEFTIAESFDLDLRTLQADTIIISKPV